MNLECIFRHPALAAALFIVTQSVSATVNTAYLDAPAARAPENRAAVSDAASEKKQRPRERPAAPANAAARRNTEASAHPAESRDAGKVQQGKGQAARANSDRVRSLLNKQAVRSRTAAAANRGGGATRGSGAPGPGAAGPSEGRTNLSQDRTNLSPGSASAMASRAAPRAAVALPQNSAARTGTLGGPRVQGSARLGGPVSINARRAAPAGTQTLNGTQVLRRKH